ncbi:MAG: ADP-ribosylglycohydrolase family protein [Capsulimonadales bacterium]|nr:ADP-ribosylglycohydrolase family protein [Capsulimonadales bacterium]
MNSLPSGYEERVYAGVLGKIIGVYLGRPFEGWNHRKIEEELGEIHYYVHEKRGTRLIVADDDISGTFTFVRALQDHNAGYQLTAEQIGKTWLNYLIEKKTVLWWGGMGVSTEHTAYNRLKAGVPAPNSGSIALNGPVVAEQIGAQIFIDAWAMVCPGDPDKAVALAGKAASVSHDGEAIYGAQIIAAIESMAFVEDDLLTLIRQAMAYIPRSSVIHTLIEDMLAWKEAEPNDWRATFRKIEDKYGYDKYGGGCHMVPNHAVILLGLLYGDNDFQKALMVTNTAGWDTDCNSANVGCIMGIKNGLDGINASVDFRTPVADRLYLPTADGGRCITDAVRETFALINIARSLQGLKPVTPNQGMRYHFNLPGSLQGFRCEDSIECADVVRLENVRAGESRIDGPPDERLLAIHYQGVGPGRVARVATWTFLPPEDLNAGGYGLVATPVLYAGQIVRARLIADESNPARAAVRLYLKVYGKDDRLEQVDGETVLLDKGQVFHVEWKVPDTGGRPIAEIGVEVGGNSRSGTVYLDWLGWTGTPQLTLGRNTEGRAGRRSWVVAADELREWGVSRSFAVVQNDGTGMVYTGTDEWTDYSMSVEAHAHLAEAWGIVACVRGLRRYVALALDRQGEQGRLRLIERYDEEERCLAEAALPWELYTTVSFSLTVHREGSLTAICTGGDCTVTLDTPLPAERAAGAAGFFVQVGHCQFGDLEIEPANA